MKRSLNQEDENTLVKISLFIQKAFSKYYNKNHPNFFEVS